ncbi:MAG: peptide transporter [Lachnospiraceae bacterium]|nr:peptide transporter [Lachnospiraceae bacterium]
MKHLIRIADLTTEDIENIFSVADEMEEHSKDLVGKTVALFFPAASVRTRISFEKGIRMLGGQPVCFPSETLDTQEDIKDFMGYLANWADCVVVRHEDPTITEYMAEYSCIPVINAMSDESHPCDVLSDLYALSKDRIDFMTDSYLFVGPRGNIGYSYLEASQVLGFSFTQCCPAGFEIPGADVESDIVHAMQEKDIILTDMNEKAEEAFFDYQVTCDLMEMANDGAVLNPCPPFIRGREVSDEVIESEFFVGYEFKKTLLRIEQAILLYCMGDMQEGMSLGWLGEQML